MKGPYEGCILKITHNKEIYDNEIIHANISRYQNFQSNTTKLHNMRVFIANKEML